MRAEQACWPGPLSIQSGSLFEVLPHTANFGQGARSAVQAARVQHKSRVPGSLVVLPRDPPQHARVENGPTPTTYLRPRFKFSFRFAWSISCTVRKCDQYTSVRTDSLACGGARPVASGSGRTQAVAAAQDSRCRQSIARPRASYQKLQDLRIVHPPEGRDGDKCERARLEERRNSQ